MYHEMTTSQTRNAFRAICQRGYVPPKPIKTRDMKAIPVDMDHLMAHVDEAFSSIGLDAWAASKANTRPGQYGRQYIESKAANERIVHFRRLAGWIKAMPKHRYASRLCYGGKQIRYSRTGLTLDWALTPSTMVRSGISPGRLDRWAIKVMRRCSIMCVLSGTRWPSWQDLAVIVQHHQRRGANWCVVSLPRIGRAAVQLFAVTKQRQGSDCPDWMNYRQARMWLAGQR